MEDEKLSVYEAARMICVTRQTMEKWRTEKNGPQYLEETPRGRMYWKSEILYFLRSHEVGHVDLSPGFRLLSCYETALELDMSYQSIARLRKKGQGPPYIQYSLRRIFYSKSDVLRFKESRL